MEINFHVRVNADYLNTILDCEDDFERFKEEFEDWISTVEMDIEDSLTHKLNMLYQGRYYAEVIVAHD